VKLSYVRFLELFFFFQFCLSRVWVVGVGLQENSTVRFVRRLSRGWIDLIFKAFGPTAWMWTNSGQLRMRY
jgi:hypothetical protein